MADIVDKVVEGEDRFLFLLRNCDMIFTVRIEAAQEGDNEGTISIKSKFCQSCNAIKVERSSRIESINQSELYLSQTTKIC